MASLEVYRGAGDRPGAPIIEPLLSDAALVTRGRAEMDQHGQQAHEIDAEILFRQGLRLGQLIELDDPTTAAPRRAKLTGLAIRIDGGRIDCALSLSEPLP